MLRQMAAPIPRVPPVTKATLPESLSPVLLVRSWVTVTGSSWGRAPERRCGGRVDALVRRSAPAAVYRQHGAARATRQGRARLPLATARRAVADVLGRVPHAPSPTRGGGPRGHRSAARRPGQYGRRRPDRRCPCPTRPPLPPAGRRGCS